MPDALLYALTRASLDGGVFAAAVWLICRIVPSLPPAARSALWWLAALKLLVALAGPRPIALPVLPAVAPAALPPITLSVARPAADALPRANDPAAPADAPALSWGIFLAGSWGIGLGVLAVRGLWRIRRTRRLARTARAAGIESERLASDLAGRLQLRARPDVRISEAIDTPQVTGLRRPVVLLPGARFGALSEAERRMVLCHELLHVKRGDLWLGCVPALAERVFFFHPLARLAAREYALAREAACDAGVLEVLDAAPQAYGRLLLRLGVSPARASFAVAGAPSTFTHLKRRLIMLDRQTTRAATRRLGWLAAAAAACAIVPVQLVARPAAHDPLLPAAAAEPRRDVPPPASAPERAERQEAPSHVRGTSMPALQPAAPASPAPATTPVRSTDLQWVLLKDGDEMSMSGRGEHVARARERQRDGRPLLWVLRQGREYVITDPALVAQAERIYQPVGDLGAKMGEVGARQGEIGRRMGEVGAKQGAVGARQGTLGAQMGALGAKQAALALRRLQKEADDAALEREQEALDAEMEKLNRQMEQLTEEMEAASQPMKDLGKEMEPLGRQLETLGREMEALAGRAEADMRALVDDAIRSGRATEPR